MLSEKMKNIKNHIKRETKEELAKRNAIILRADSKDFSKMTDEQLNDYIVESSKAVKSNKA